MRVSLIIIVHECKYNLLEKQYFKRSDAKKEKKKDILFTFQFSSTEMLLLLVNIVLLVLTNSRPPLQNCNKLKLLLLLFGVMFLGDR